MSTDNRRAGPGGARPASAAPAATVAAPGGPARGSFTGRRRRTTRRSVKIIDRVARWVITVGGIGVTVAFAAIVIFLASVVVPLFLPPKVTHVASVELPAAAGPGQSGRAARGAAAAGAAASTPAARAGMIAAMEMDEYRATLWSLDDRGTLATYRLGGGELVKSEPLSPDVAVTAVSGEHGLISLGRNDGTVIAGRVKHELQWVKEVPDAMESLTPGQTMLHDGGVAMMTPGGAGRVIRVVAELSEPVEVGAGSSPVRLVDYAFGENLEAVVALRDDGKIFYSTIETRDNMMTGEVTRTAGDSFDLPYDPKVAAGKRPAGLFLGQGGEAVFVVYPDGLLLRFNTRDTSDLYLAETTDVVPEGGATVTAVRMLLGDLTLIVADSNGGVSGWFPAPYPDGTPDGAKNRDHQHMVRGHELARQAAPVTAIATSARDRQFVTGDAEGRVVLRHMTSGNTQKAIALPGGRAVTGVAMSPTNDAVVAVDAGRAVSLYEVNNPHPEGSLRALFLPVHYEGYAEPAHVYQSSSGHQEAEPKLGLTLLVFGTLKATFYAMLFAVPIAILAAIYTSEFMSPQVRSVVKPLVEMMASLPSVVLGFIAALILAPFVEHVVPAVLMTFAAVPLSVMAVGFVWQALPPRLFGVLPNWARFAVMIALVAGAIFVCFLLGPRVEALLFAGDFRAWASGRVGSGIPAWAILLTPLLGVGLALAFNLWIKPNVPIFNASAGQHRLLVAALDLTRFVALAAVAVGAACLVGWALTAAGWDLRDAVLGKYTQRNSLIVGIIMGFAIIPIIYTVSEDALGSVPATLRSASLGAGATPWQTAVRVVLPVAISGIFSACMIGFGRAAGETMILLMAAGNTPILDVNPFTGLRALSANIAVELPEAPVGSTHYRVLFLSALVLFAMTFVVNTVAEVVRIRFRKRAYQL